MFACFEVELHIGRSILVKFGLEAVANPGIGEGVAALCGGLFGDLVHGFFGDVVGFTY